MRTCDKCRADIMELPLMKVIDGKEYDLCQECAKWFDDIGEGRPEHQATVLVYKSGDDTVSGRTEASGTAVGG